MYMLHDEGGKFTSPYPEPRGKPIQFRLPKSMDEKMRAKVARELGKPTGDLTTYDIRMWIEKAIDHELHSTLLK